MRVQIDIRMDSVCLQQIQGTFQIGIRNIIYLRTDSRKEANAWELNQEWYVENFIRFI